MSRSTATRASRRLQNLEPEALGLTSSRQGSDSSDGRPRNLRLGPREFKYFMELPKEIRLIIWETVRDSYPKNLISVYSKMITRVRTEIEIQESYPSSVWALIESHGKANEVIASRTAEPEEVESAAARYTIPGILNACRESRKIAIKRYKPKYEDRLPEGFPIWASDGDVLCMDTLSACYTFFGGTSRVLRPLLEHQPTIALKFDARSFSVYTEFQQYHGMGAPAEVIVLRDNRRLEPEEHDGMVQYMDHLWNSRATVAVELNYLKPPTLRSLTTTQYRAELKRLPPPEPAESKS